MAVLTALQIPLHHATHIRRIESRRVPHSASYGFDQGWNAQHDFAGTARLNMLSKHMWTTVVSWPHIRWLLYVLQFLPFAIERMGDRMGVVFA